MVYFCVEIIYSTFFKMTKKKKPKKPNKLGITESSSLPLKKLNNHSFKTTNVILQFIFSTECKGGFFGVNCSEKCGHCLKNQ